MDVLVPDHDREPALDSTPFYRPKPDGDLNPAGEAGWYLQREREKRGLSLDQICEATGIHPYHVEAIEMGDLTRLPQRLEALEMVGIYGEYMGFEPEPLVTHYAAFLPRPQGNQGKAHPADPGPLSSAKILRFGKMPPFPRFSIKSFPGGAGGVIGSCFAAILLFAAASWVMQPVPGIQPGEETAQNEPLDQAGDPMPTATTGQSDTDVAVSEEPMPEEGAQAKVEDETPSAGKEPTGEEDGLSGIGAFIEDGFQQGSETQPQKAAPTPQSKKPAADKPAAATPPADPGSRLVLRAKAPVWVRIEDAQGNVVMTQMLRGGDTYSVPDRQGLVVIARDGGLLSYIIDGKERGILGTPGQILVGQPLDIPTLEKRG
ncbi:helix-turn-helix domain-containing protein [Taklimakanibacter deserti]|uniref:helix-turn-helix domain-containing protein n=1 Tax=Taklimakanibacter deserti TaxID=2267839 RepID=UPI000E6483EC